MTKKRILKCDNPNCPWEKLKGFSDWIREELPDSSTGYQVTDIDWFMWLRNENKKAVILLETKTNGANVCEWQQDMLRAIHTWIKNGIGRDWLYLGLHVVIFERYSPTDGRILFDKKEITPITLKKILSFDMPIEKILDISQDLKDMEEEPEFEKIWETP